MSIELERISKDAAVVLFKVFSRDLPVVTEKTTKSLSQDNRSPGQEFSPGLAEYEAGMLPI